VTDLCVIIDDLIGVPFEMGGRGPKTYDCYGAVKEVRRRMGLYTPEVATTYESVRSCADVIRQQVKHWLPCEPKNGAVLILRLEALHAHVGVQIAPGWLLHTWEEAGGIVRERVDRWQKQNRIVGYYDYPASNRAP
jgi:cell wall-associated NlpC family hydrolase